MSGPAYLVSSTRRVPDLVFDLRGQGLAIQVSGQIDSRNGGIRTRFNTIPDAPITRFTLRMPGGKRGILVNSEFLCGAPQRAAVTMVGQENSTRRYAAPIKVAACKNHKKRTPRREQR